jgi:hypothetical protein
MIAVTGCTKSVLRRRRTDFDRRAAPERRSWHEFRLVERLAGDVGAVLHAERAVLERALRFCNPGVECPQRNLRYPPREVVLLLGAQFDEAVVDDAAELVDVLRRFGETLDPRLRIGQDLLIVFVPVDDLLAHVNIEQRRQRTDALASVVVVAGGLIGACRRISSE